MFKRATYYIIIVFAISLSSGCVSQGTYQLKENEAKGLMAELTELQQQYEKLQKENFTLKADLKTAKAEVAGLERDKQRVIQDKSALEDILKAKTDNLSKNINDLRQRIVELENENKKLYNDISSLQKGRDDQNKAFSALYEKLLENMKSEISKGQVTVSELKGKLTINMEAAILFNSGSADVKKDGISILLKLVPTLRELKDKSIHVEGHTDDVPINTERFPSNWELSAARAINVVKYLQQQEVNPEYLSAVAYAEYRPVADNSSVNGRAENRRIDITLMGKE